MLVLAPCLANHRFISVVAPGAPLASNDAFNDLTTGFASAGANPKSRTAIRTIVGYRNKRLTQRQIRARLRINRRCVCVHARAALDSQLSRTSPTTIGATERPDANAQAIPSPVNGSTYPAASPMKKHRSAATRLRCCVSRPVPCQFA